MDNATSTAPPLAVVTSTFGNSAIGGDDTDTNIANGTTITTTNHPSVHALPSQERPSISSAITKRSKKKTRPKTKHRSPTTMTPLQHQDESETSRTQADSSRTSNEDDGIITEAANGNGGDTQVTTPKDVAAPHNEDDGNSSMAIDSTNQMSDQSKEDVSTMSASPPKTRSGAKNRKKKESKHQKNKETRQNTALANANDSESMIPTQVEYERHHSNGMEPPPIMEASTRLETLRVGKTDKGTVPSKEMSRKKKKKSSKDVDEKKKSEIKTPQPQIKAEKDTKAVRDGRPGNANKEASKINSISHNVTSTAIPLSKEKKSLHSSEKKTIPTYLQASEPPPIRVLPSHHHKQDHKATTKVHGKSVTVSEQATAQVSAGSSNGVSTDCDKLHVAPQSASSLAHT